MSLIIVFLIFGTLVPMLHSMHSRLQVKKERVTAYETMFEGAKQAKEGVKSGVRIIDGTVFDWTMADRLCVSYTSSKGEEERICSGD